ncbi:hypothetical protein Tco_0860125 [Tanacetum coccineum]|uniref:DUF4283 domain-containing protein n=1 Tax=Tanacetum coccineum TaxID=301880 RepID=A0ABQ5BHU2_9ASTR
MVWVEISGLPLCAWGSNAFKKVASSVGKFMFFEKDETGAMSLGRVSIATKHKKFISKTTKARALVSTNEFSIKRSLHQGDPLSHFLFIIVMEGLHFVLKDAVSSGLLRGTKVFYLASRLKINISKSHVYGLGVSMIDSKNMARDTAFNLTHTTMTGPDVTVTTLLSNKLSLVTHHHLLTRVPVKLDLDNWNYGSWEFFFYQLCYSYEFVRDNNCTIEFDEFGFSVKDFMTRWVLLRCDSTGDLYPVMAPSLIPHVFLVSQYTWNQRLGHP